jgi:hypothetical protein
MPLSKLHAAARAYAEKGWPVFPIVANAKTPYMKGAFYEATCDLAQIDKWWAIYFPDANIGFCPEHAGMCVVDVDLGAASYLSFDPTRRVQTPRGGQHHYYAGSLKGSQSKIAKHVDTRGQGSYVLLPPSVVDGNPYSWLNGEPMGAFELTQVPPEIAAVLNAETAGRDRPEAIKDVDLDRSPAIKAARAYLKHCIAMDPDDPDQDDYAVACRVLDLGISEEKGVELALELGGDEEWIALKFENAAAYRQNEPACDAEFPIDRLSRAGGLAPDQPASETRESTKPADHLKDWTPHDPRDPEDMPEGEFFDGKYDTEVA